LSFDTLINAIRDVDPTVRTYNLSVTLEKMRKIGDVTLARREGKIRTVSLFDYSPITSFKKSAAKKNR
jgi:hypothetical protein